MSCLHETVEPVTLAGEGTVVATVCVSCFARLPVGWGCEDCTYDDLYSYAEHGPVARVMTQPCRKHHAAG